MLTPSALRYDDECSIEKPNTAIINIWNTIASVSVRKMYNTVRSTKPSCRMAPTAVICTNKKSVAM